MNGKYTTAYMYGYLLSVIIALAAMIVHFDHVQRSDGSNISLGYFEHKSLEHDNSMKTRP